MAPSKKGDIQVLISYKDLCDLMDTASEVPKLRKEVKKLSDQQQALWGQFTTMMELFGEIRKHLND